MRKVPKLIAFTGKAGAGKNTAAAYIASSLRFAEESLAEPMKLGLQTMFGLTDEQVFGSKDEKEAVIPKLSKKKKITGRLLMQTLATEWARVVIDDDVWLYHIQEKYDRMINIPGWQGMVINDLRFDNEAEWVKSKGGIIIEIRDIKTPQMTPHLRLPNYMPQTGDHHVSENGVHSRYIDYTIFNAKLSKELLYADIDRALVTHMDNTKNVSNAVESLSSLIVNWANSVFPDRTITNAISKMVLEEIPEYLMNQKDPMELADLGILLYDIAHLAGVDLEKAIREKMEINKTRTWEIDQLTGLMKHVDKEEYL
jgi:hypothetical protein